jgi:hypothetical protein
MELETRLYNKLFLRWAKIRERLVSRRKMKILFTPKADWEDPIRRGFRNTQHEISFQELSPEVIKGCDLVVPLSLAGLRYLNEEGHRIPDNPLPIPSLESIGLFDDKCRFNQLLKENGLGKFIPRNEGKLDYPYMLKKRVDDWGQSCHIINNVKDEAAASAALADPEYFTQQLVVGSTEYATHLLFKGGEILYGVNVEYTFNTSTPIKGRDKELRRRVCRCRHLKLFSTILGLTDFEGLCCFNYKTAEDGSPMILENNPRFGGSLAPYFFSFVKYLH